MVADLAQLQDRRALGCGFFIDAGLNLAADHGAGQRLLIGLGHVRNLGYGFAPAQDENAVADGHDLPQLVGDEEDAFSLLLQAADDGKKPLGLLICQDGGGLIQNQDLRAAREP